MKMGWLESTMSVIGFLTLGVGFAGYIIFIGVFSPWPVNAIAFILAIFNLGIQYANFGGRLSKTKVLGEEPK